MVCGREYAVPCQTYEPGVLIQGDYGGYQIGTDTANYFGDDKYVWFIESPVYG